MAQVQQLQRFQTVQHRSSLRLRKADARVRVTDDAGALRQIAHRIKGTSVNLQALMLSAAARELE